MADQQQGSTPNTQAGADQAERGGETLDVDLKAEDQRRNQPQDPEAEEELSGSPT